MLWYLRVKPYLAFFISPSPSVTAHTGLVLHREVLRRAGSAAQGQDGRSYGLALWCDSDRVLRGGVSGGAKPQLQHPVLTLEDELRSSAMNLWTQAGLSPHIAPTVLLQVHSVWLLFPLELQLWAGKE